MLFTTKTYEKISIKAYHVLAMQVNPHKDIHMWISYFAVCKFENGMTAKKEEEQTCMSNADKVSISSQILKQT